ncbi:MAG: acetoacetate--CoA ligase [Polyangiaceae bacterium]
MTQLLHRASPDVAATSQLAEFARFVGQRTGVAFDDYPALHAFSTRESARFWALLLEWSGMAAEGEPEPVRVGSDVAGARFFPGLRTSWPENLLAVRGPREEQAIAIVAVDETGTRTEITRAALRRRVRAVAAGLQALGLREGDRVAALVRNTVDTVVACLAVTSLGATWSSLALDMGSATVLARLTPLAPRLLLCHQRTRMNGALIQAPVHPIAGALPSLEAVVRLDPDDGEGLATPPGGLRWTTLRDVEREGNTAAAATSEEWPRFAFDHPLFVLFSSGTTGAPKGIVHGHGGTLLEHLKEQRLHCDLRPSDTLCFQTSTGWMMWNWTLSALATGARIVLYDGSVSYPERDTFLKLAARERVTVLGVSPAYLQYLVDAGATGMHDELGEVRTILSTGSVLHGHLHRWAREHLARAPVESISGGTDILGCFVMGSPWSSTYEGESSCIGLGLDVRAWTERGPSTEGAGELVCMAPFPSRPVAFLDDPSSTRLHHAYYEQHPGAWTHGDLVELTARGTARVLGRCDGVLNIRGIRIGPSEIYDILGRRVPEVLQAMAVDAAAPHEPGGKRLVLFVVVRPGATLDRPLTLRIKKELKEGASAAHVPAVIVAVDELPVTFSNKLSEAALQDALNGRPVRNLSALRNPGAVEGALARWRAAATEPAPRAVSHRA